MIGSFDFLTFPICYSLSRHISWSVSIDSLGHRFGAKCCSVCRCYLPSNLDGSLSYLPKQFVWQAIDCYDVWITGSPPPNSQSYPFRQIVDFEYRGLLERQNEVNSCICYYIKDIWINLTHYSIHSRCDYNGDHLRSRILGNEMMNWSGWELMMGRVTPRWIVQMPFLHFRLQQDFKNSVEWLALESQGRMVIAQITSQWLWVNFSEFWEGETVNISFTLLWIEDLNHRNAIHIYLWILSTVSPLRNSHSIILESCTNELSNPESMHPIEICKELWKLPFSDLLRQNVSESDDFQMEMEDFE
jgi:hypothetical protein